MIKSRPTATPDAIEAARAAAVAIDDKNGEDILLLDLSSLLVVTDVFVVASGTSNRHVRTLVEEAEEALKALGRRPLRREGVDHGEWVLIDYGDVVIHVFDRPTRAYYELERLWADAPMIDFERSPSNIDA
ncbi:MAG TPA: ribosome silencing factor [Acidimicrobiia bacterium]|nr:ribosome silencing factor [Acidimicrobiia bacterium]